MRSVPALLLLFLLAPYAYCAGTNPPQPVSEEVSGKTDPCPGRDKTITVPDGFCIEVVADDLGRVRHIAARDNGDLFARLLRAGRGGGIVALRDGDGDGRFEKTQRFFAEGGTGIGLWDEYLYFSTPQAIYRQKLSSTSLLPAGDLQTVVSGFPPQGQHAAKSFAISGDGALFVNIGAPSNACQKRTRTSDSPGRDPCPQLKEHAGIWRFAADRTGQDMGDGERFASGIRNAVAIAWNPFADHLYVVQHGRDQLHQFWPDLYTVEENARLPAEEFFLINEGDDFGWPYCYYDQIREKKVLAPEYGGDGKTVGRCDQFESPIAAFPGHWAPNGLHFYTGQQFPQYYRGGAFIAFHGSWNRAPLPQQGYKVVFVPFSGSRPDDERFDFATGFPGTQTVERTGDARYRPMDLTQGPDGSLYISDSRQGRIWRVRYTGSS